ncbi:MAG: CAP domain-containing protein [Acidimicrobiia bacterium]
MTTVRAYRAGAVLLVLALVLPGLALPASASPTMESQFVELINAERTSRGLPALPVFWDLVDDARAHSAEMAAAADIWHNPCLAQGTSGWWALGENVGMGPNVPVLHDAFMNSEPHEKNILGDYNYLGVGVVVSGGIVYVTVVFMLGPAGLVSEPSVPAGFPVADSVGYLDTGSGLWCLVTAGGGVAEFYYGNPADLPVMCDWNGDGVETVGLYRPSTGFLHLRNSNTQGSSDVAIFYGGPSDLPVCGDWNGDGVDTIGIYRPSQAAFYLRNSNTQGTADLAFYFGNHGDVPFAGDWNGDGIDTVGIYRPSTGQVMITNSHGGVAHYSGYYGNPGDRFVVGDWDGDGRDSFGIFRPSEGTFYLSNSIGGPADVTVGFGSWGVQPVAGGW